MNCLGQVHLVANFYAYMEEKKLWELLGKKITGEAEGGELGELNRLLEKYPEALYTLETMEHYWRSSGENADSLQRESALERHLRRLPPAAAAPGESDDAVGRGEHVDAEWPTERGEPAGTVWRTGSHETGLRRLPLYRRYMAGTAAAAAVFVGCLLLIPALRKKGNRPSILPLRQMAVTTMGERRQVQLPDGSTVWLNAGTTIQYIQRPGADSLREVSLSGEAFFEVKHDAAHPFLVHTQDMDIRDLGTSFNVKAYPLDPMAEATLVEGSIDVRLNKEKGGAVLTRPHQKFTVFSGSGNDSPGLHPDEARRVQVMKRKPVQDAYLVSTAVIDAADSLLAETAWMKNMLVFRNESFEDLATRLERWYDVSIRFTDSDQARYRFTGVLADETLEQALQELQLMKSFHFRITGKTVSIGK